MTRDQHATIEAFLDRASERISEAPNKIPFEPARGNLVIAWLRGQLTAERDNLSPGTAPSTKAGDDEIAELRNDLTTLRADVNWILTHVALSVARLKAGWNRK
jgi:hypothetical protein